MKKYLSFGMLVMVLMTLCVNLSSCSDDDDENPGSGNNNFNPTAELSVDGVSKKINLIRTFYESSRGIGDFEITIESEEIAFTVTLNSLEVVELGKNYDLKNENAYFRLQTTDGNFNFKSASIFYLENFDLEKEEMTIEFNGTVNGKGGDHNVKGKVSTKFKKSNGTIDHTL